MSVLLVVAFSRARGEIVASETSWTRYFGAVNEPSPTTSGTVFAAVSAAGFSTFILTRESSRKRKIRLKKKGFTLFFFLLLSFLIYGISSTNQFLFSLLFFSLFDVVYKAKKGVAIFALAPWFRVRVCMFRIRFYVTTCFAFGK